VFSISVNVVKNAGNGGQPHCRELCQQASVEQDLEKLMELIKEITRLLDVKEAELRQKTLPPEDNIRAIGTAPGSWEEAS